MKIFTFILAVLTVMIPVIYAVVLGLAIVYGY